MVNLPFSNSHWKVLQKELEGTTTKGDTQQNTRRSSCFSYCFHCPKSPSILSLTAHNTLSFGILAINKHLDFFLCQLNPHTTMVFPPIFTHYILHITELIRRNMCIHGRLKERNHSELFSHFFKKKIT